MRRSGIGFLIFSMVLLFQLSMIKYTLGIGGVATVVNSLVLLGLSLLAAKNIVTGAFVPSVWGIYLLPGSLVYCGYLLNISMNLATNAGVVSALGLLIPWAAYLSVPFLIRNSIDGDTVWRFFYRFMFSVSVIGLLEYVAAFRGVLPLRAIDTPLGTFLSGGLSVFHSLDDGSPHDRLYAIFPEPGTFAMYLLPSIMYALVYKKYLGVIVFAGALYLTGSLGGFISLLLLVPLYVYVRVRSVRLSFGFSVFLLVILAAGLIGYVFPDLSEAYLSKNLSAAVRVANVSNALENMPSLVLKYPFGMTLAEGSLSNIVSEDYFGSNFALGSALVMGGLLSLLGYAMVLIYSLIIPLASLTERISNLDQRVVFPSLLVVMPFVVQRATVMDSAVFAFLFAPSIVRYLESRRRNRRLVKVAVS